MKDRCAQDWIGPGGTDRELIQIETAEYRASITAALRRAFQAAAAEPSDHDFAALLARLN